MKRSFLLWSVSLVSCSCGILSAQESFRASWDFDGTSQSLVAIINHEELEETYGIKGELRAPDGQSIEFSMIDSQQWVSISNAAITDGTTYLEFELVGLPLSLANFEFSSALVLGQAEGRPPSISGWQISTQDRDLGIWSDFSILDFGGLPDKTTTPITVGGLVLTDSILVSGIRVRVDFIVGPGEGNQDRNLNFSQTSFTSTMLMVPEPSAYAAIFGGLMFGLTLIRRRLK